MADLARSIEAGELSASRPLRVIDHYVGADGVDNLEAWLRRLLYRLKSLIGDDELTIPEAPKDQKDAAVTWIARAARSPLAGGSPEAPVTFVLMVDALDQLNDRGKDLSLLMPDVLGADVVVVTSAAEGTPAIESAEKWGKVEVPPLTADLRQAIIEDTLGRFRKKLPPEDAKRLAEAPQCGSPLFLTLALEELRVDAHHETLSTLVDHILQSNDAQSLFLNNFLLDPDYSRPQQPDLAVRFMALLGAAYAGLTEQQLADLLALPDDPIAEDTGKPRLPQSALSHLLNNFGGFLLDKRDRRAPMHRLFGEIALQHCGEENVREQLYVAFHALAEKSDDNKAEALHQVTWLAENPESSRDSSRSRLLEGIELWIGLHTSHPKVLRDALAKLDDSEREDITSRWESTCSSLLDDRIELSVKFWTECLNWLEEITFNQYQTSVRVTESLLKRLKLWNATHEATMDTMASLGSFYGAVGRFQEANCLETEVLNYRRDILGPEHPDTLTSMGNLAVTLSKQGDYTGARELEETVLEARRCLLGPEHLDSLTSMSNLASTLGNKGDHAAARELQEKVLEVRRRLLGPEHPDTLGSMDNLAFTLSAQGDYASASELLESSLEASRRLLGPEHPDTLRSMNNLASTRHYQGNFAGARDLQEPVLEISRRLLGPEHPRTLISMGNLANILRNQGDNAGALQLAETVLEALRRRLGTEHPDTLISMSTLAFTYWNLKQYANCRTLESLLLNIKTSQLGADHLDTKKAKENLSQTLNKLAANRHTIDLLTHPDFANTLAYAKAVAKHTAAPELSLSHLRQGMKLAVQNQILLSDFELSDATREQLDALKLPATITPDTIERIRDPMKLSADTKAFIQSHKRSEFIEFSSALMS
jgi:tetratricopeptide (TPR) repeat protein